METRTPEMRKWIMEANEKEFRGFLVDKIYDNKVTVSKKIDDFQANHTKEHTCIVGNGIKREIALNKAVGILFDKQEFTESKIDKIASATEVLVDISRLHFYAKKLKIYWLISLIVSLFFTHSWWQPLVVKILQ